MANGVGDAGGCTQEYCPEPPLDKNTGLERKGLGPRVFWFVSSCS
jgi:hypothetical protein